jgi:hypothetical protein
MQAFPGPVTLSQDLMEIDFLTNQLLFRAALFFRDSSISNRLFAHQP